MSDTQFCDLAVELGISLEQAKQCYEKLKTGNTEVIGAMLVEELKKSHSLYIKQFVIQLEQQAIEIVKNAESKYGQMFVDVISKAAPSDDGNISKSELTDLLRQAYKQMTPADIKTLLSLIQTDENGKTTITEIQNFLKKYTSSKKVKESNNSL